MSYENLYNDLINESLYDGPNPSDKKKCTPKSNDELTQIAFSGSVKTEINEIVRSVIQNSLTPVFYTLNILNILRPGNNILEEDALYTTKPLNVPGSGNTKAAEAIPRVVGLDTIDIYPNYVSVNFRNCYVKNYFTYDFIIDPQTYTLKYRIKSAFNDSDGTDRSHAFIIQFGSFYDFTDYRRELRFNDTANYAAYIKNLKQSIKKIRSAIPVKLGTVDTNTQAPEFLKLYYLYKNIPTELLSEFDTELLQDDLLLLLSYDEAYRSFFSDSYFEKNINNQLKSKNAKDPSSALLKIIALLKLKNKLPELTEYLYKYPKLINRIYTNLNDEIVYNGETIPSRYLWVMIVEELIFTRFGETFKKDPIAVFDYMVRHSGGFFNEDKSYGNVDQNNNKTSKKATLKIVDDKIAIIQETTHYKISKDWINAGEDTVGELEYLTSSYFPHELIVIFNNGNPEIHTALYWYNLQQNKKQEELAKTLRIAGDLIALALGIYGYFEGGWLIVELSIADIIFSLEDIAITTFHDELEELLGKEFIATFDQFMEFYTLALAVIFTPLLITGFLRSVIRILAKLSPGALKVMTKFYKFIGSLVKKLPSDHPLKNIFSHDLEFWGKNMNKLDEVVGVSYLRRGNYLGQVLENFDLIKIEKFLTENNVLFQLGKNKGSVEVEGFFYKSGNPVTLKPHEAAMFITDGVNMKLVLRENATIYEFLHELMHLRDCQKIGMKQFLQKPLVDKEKFVYDKMVEYSKYLNREELKHAEDYINQKYYDFGVTDNLGNPIKEISPFDFKNIPKKRQGVSINTIMNLK